MLSKTPLLEEKTIYLSINSSENKIDDSFERGLNQQMARASELEEQLEEHIKPVGTCRFISRNCQQDRRGLSIAGTIFGCIYLAMIVGGLTLVIENDDWNADSIALLLCIIAVLGIGCAFTPCVAPYTNRLCSPGTFDETYERMAAPVSDDLKNEVKTVLLELKTDGLETGVGIRKTSYQLNNHRKTLAYKLTLFNAVKTAIPILSEVEKELAAVITEYAFEPAGYLG